MCRGGSGSSSSRSSLGRAGGSGSSAKGGGKGGCSSSDVAWCCRLADELLLKHIMGKYQPIRV